TRTWTEARVLRGHADEVYAAAISEPAQLVASLSKDGDLVLWKDDGRGTVDGYTRLPDNLRFGEVWPMNHSTLLCQPEGNPPELLDLQSTAAGVADSLRGLVSSVDVLGFFDTNILCHWDGSQILVRELLGEKFVQRRAISLECKTRPTGVAYQTG